MENDLKLTKKKSLDNQSLSDITRGLHHAASSTSAMLAQQYIHMIKQFFDVNEQDGTLQAKMVQIGLDKEHDMLVPLISLVAPKGIALDRMKVHLAAKVEQVNKIQATLADNSKAERSSFQVSFAPRSSKVQNKDSELMDIELEFKATNPPEGVMRLIEEYTNMIHPIKKQLENSIHTSSTVVNTKLHKINDKI